MRRTKKGVTLTAWCEHYILSRDLCPLYQRDIRRVVQWFTAFNGDDRLDRLTDDALNKWARQMQADKLNPKSVKNRLTVVCAVWRDAFMANECDTEPRRVVKVKIPRSQPVAWSADELRQLLTVAEGVPLFFKRTGIKKSSFWRAFTLTAYDSGLRLNDLERLTRQQIEPDGRIRLIQHKTGMPHTVHLRPETIAAIDALEPWNAPGRDGVIFWWPAGRTEFFRQFRKLVRQAGLTTSHGVTRRIRRTSATMAESVQPGIASAHLGHSPSSGDLAGRFYLDRSKLPERVTTPPSLLTG